MSTFLPRFNGFYSGQQLCLARSESGPHECEVPAAVQHQIYLLVQSDNGLVRQRRAGLHFEGVRMPGDIGIVPAGSYGYCHCEAHTLGIAVQLPPAVLQETAQSVFHSDRLDLSVRFAVRDETLRNLILLLHREQEMQTEATRPSDQPGDRLLFESLATAFAVQLLRFHTQERLPAHNEAPELARGLSLRVQRQVLEYIHDNLGAEVSLETMAGVAGLSRYHFLRAFKISLGLTPHQYLVQQRVELAKRLMAQGQFSLREVAMLSGFGDQSHLTRQFRRLTGTTPRAFQVKSSD